MVLKIILPPAPHRYVDEQPSKRVVGSGVPVNRDVQVEWVPVTADDLVNDGVDDCVLKCVRAQLLAKCPTEPKSAPLIVDVALVRRSIAWAHSVELAGVYEGSENFEQLGIVFWEVNGRLFVLVPASPKTGEEEVGVVS